MNHQINIQLLNNKSEIRAPYCPIIIKSCNACRPNIAHEQMVVDVLKALSESYTSGRFLPDGNGLNSMLHLKGMGTNAEVVTALIYERESYFLGMTYDDVVTLLVNEIVFSLTKNGYGPARH